MRGRKLGDNIRRMLFCGARTDTLAGSVVSAAYSPYRSSHINAFNRAELTLICYPFLSLPSITPSPTSLNYPAPTHSSPHLHPLNDSLSPRHPGQPLHQAEGRIRHGGSSYRHISKQSSSPKTMAGSSGILGKKQKLNDSMT